MMSLIGLHDVFDNLYGEVEQNVSRDFQTDTEAWAYSSEYFVELTSAAF